MVGRVSMVRVHGDLTRKQLQKRELEEEEVLHRSSIKFSRGETLLIRRVFIKAVGLWV